MPKRKDSIDDVPNNTKKAKKTSKDLLEKGTFSRVRLLYTTRAFLHGNTCRISAIR